MTSDFDDGAYRRMMERNRAQYRDATARAIWPASYARAIDEAIEAQCRETERRIRVCLRPRPRWVPERAWLWLASKFIRLEQLQGSYARAP